MKGQFSIQLVFCMISVSLAKPPPFFLEYKDSLGQYSFGYSAPGSARSEVRSIDGTTRGSYSYVDDSGMIQTAEYIADGEHGFQVTATNLPQAPRPIEDTPEVVAARIDHFRALEAASKLAEDNPEDNGQRAAIDSRKSTHSIVIDNSVEIAEDKMNVGAKSVENSASSIRTNLEESRSVNDGEAKKAIGNNAEVENQSAPVMILERKNQDVLSEVGNLEKTQSVNSGEAEEGIAKSDGVENEGATVKIPEKAIQDRSSEPIQPQVKSAEGRSDVPVVTTSFVIPGSVNLHTRIELDQSGAAGARISPESSPLFIAQPSISQSQAATLNPSLLTPAGTKMMTMNESEKSELLDRMSSLPASSMKSTTSNEPQQYSSTIVPGAIAPSNVFALPYGVGVDPIYHQYNPYRYFPYGIL